MNGLLCDEAGEEVVIPGGEFAAEAEGVFSLGLADQVESDVLGGGEVCGGVVGAEPALRALVRDAYAPWIAIVGQQPGPMLDDYAERIHAGQAWITEDKLAAIVLERTGDSLLIDNVAVAPEAQGRGIGRALMAFAESEARRLGLRALTLYTHAKMTSNIALYHRLGFVETRRVTEKGFDRVYMRRDLT